MDLKNLIRPEIQKMAAYQVPKATGLVKLDAMENPFSWPDEMKAEWLELLSTAEPNRYPDPTAKELVEVCVSVLALAINWALYWVMVRMS